MQFWCFRVHQHWAWRTGQTERIQRNKWKLDTTNKPVKALQLLSLSLLSINLTLATNHSLIANKLLAIIYTWTSINVTQSYIWTAQRRINKILPLYHKAFQQKLLGCGYLIVIMYAKHRDTEWICKPYSIKHWILSSLQIQSSTIYGAWQVTTVLQWGNICLWLRVFLEGLSVYECHSCMPKVKMYWLRIVDDSRECSLAAATKHVAYKTSPLS